MTYTEKKQVKKEIFISSIVLLLITGTIVLIEFLFPHIINVKNSVPNSLILRITIPTVGLYLGFIITTLVMKFNYLDGIIQKIVEDLNSIMYNSSRLRNSTLVQSDIVKDFEKYLQTSNDKDREGRIFENYKNMCWFRQYHKDWMKYPLYYSFLTLLISFILLVFNETISKLDLFYSGYFILCCLMTVWTVYINITFVHSFFDNPFINAKKRKEL